MKPEKLIFYGVKSYIDKTTIDFNKLLSSGLFGIFGNTGSGKSTILDCIFLALYGSLPTKATREDFINVKVGKCMVDFTFSIIEETNRVYYRIVREYELKKERKNPPQPTAKLYSIEDDVSIPLEDNTIRVNAKVQEIIGLTLDDFEKCIVLPQGEFSAFVKLGRKDRLNMISGLFNLKKYGEALWRKAKDNLEALNKVIDIKDAEISSYSDATKEALKECEAQLNIAKSDYENENVNYDKILQEFNDYKVNYERHNKLIGFREQLNLLNKKSTEINKLKEQLDKVDMAKSYVDNLNLIEKNNYDLKSNNLKIDALNEEISDLNKQLQTCLINLEKEAEFNLSILTLAGQIATLDLFLNKDADILKQRKELENCRKKYSETKNNINNLNNQIDQENEQYLSKLSEEDFTDIDKKMQQQIDLLTKSAITKFALEQLEFLKLLKRSIGNLALLDERIDMLSSFESDNQDEKLIIQRIWQLYELLNKLNQINTAHDKAISGLNARLSVETNNLNTIEDNGKIYSNLIRKHEEEVNKLTGGESLANKISALNKEKTNIENLLANLRANKEKFEKQIQEKKLSLSKLTESNKYLVETNNKLSADNEVLLQVLESEENAREIYKLFPNKHKHSAAIQEHLNQLTSIKANIEVFEKDLANGDYSAENYKKMALNVSESEKIKDEVYKNYSKLLFTYKNLSQNFEKRCTIEEQKTILLKEKEVVSVLYDAVKGDRFLEFVAEEYLIEISLDAKSILMELTGGRFGLIYDSNFYVEDFIYADGERRRVDAVSGGELFLVSLSLALALSKSIYARSARPMEFFFLDEGFGSLDKELIEVVVDCLYKLKNSDFSIGIISHVEALKERLPIRINVSGAKTDSGSTVTITA